MKTFLLILLMIVFAPAMTGQVLAREFIYDVGLSAQDITFSLPVDRMPAHDFVRIYAKITNYGSSDMMASVAFYKGVQLIGRSQEISIRADGLADEVFVDWEVPTEPFSITAKIQNSQPGDQNLLNNETQSILIVPLPDRDKDAIPDTEDTDDDNDNVSDIDEIAQGTNPNNPDSDEDGVLDDVDYYPLDSAKQEQEVIIQPVPEEKQPVVEESRTNNDSASQNDSTGQTENAQDNNEQNSSDQESEVEIVDEAQDNQTLDELQAQILDADGILEKVKIVVSQIAWGEYEFSFVTDEVDINPADLNHVWEFGDGETSSTSGIHKYKQPGSYFVKVKIDGEYGNTIKDVVEVNVPFFSIYNIYLWGAGLLILFVAIVLVIFIKK